MEIKILGMGCAKCMKLYDFAQGAVEELGIDASIQKVEDIKDIMSYGVMSTPALVIDKKVIFAGKTASKKELIEIISSKK